MLGVSILRFFFPGFRLYHCWCFVDFSRLRALDFDYFGINVATHLRVCVCAFLLILKLHNVEELVLILFFPSEYDHPLKTLTVSMCHLNCVAPMVSMCHFKCVVPMVSICHLKCVVALVSMCHLECVALMVSMCHLKCAPPMVSMCHPNSVAPYRLPKGN